MKSMTATNSSLRQNDIYQKEYGYTKAEERKLKKRPLVCQRIFINFFFEKTTTFLDKNSTKTSTFLFKNTLRLTLHTLTVLCSLDPCMISRPPFEPIHIAISSPWCFSNSSSPSTFFFNLGTFIHRLFFLVSTFGPPSLEPSLPIQSPSPNSPYPNPHLYTNYV